MISAPTVTCAEVCDFATWFYETFSYICNIGIDPIGNFCLTICDKYYSVFRQEDEISNAKWTIFMLCKNLRSVEVGIFEIRVDLKEISEDMIFEQIFS
jgi:hypothetical protein